MTVRLGKEESGLFGAADLDGEKKEKPLDLSRLKTLG